MNYTTAVFTYIGLSGLLAFDDFPGFNHGQQYRLRYLVRQDRVVSIELNYSPAAQRLIVTVAQFREWFVSYKTPPETSEVF